MNTGEKRTAAQIVTRGLFAVYALWMAWLLFGQRFGTQIYSQQLARSLNLKPFATVGMYWRLLTGGENSVFWRHAVINLAGNVGMFVPLGFFLPRIFPRVRKFLSTFFLCLLSIVAVEIIQYFTMLGACDIDDLILNMIGICVGYLLSKLKGY